MSCFKLFKGFVKELEVLIRKFWWGYNGDSQKVHWVNWKCLCEAKEVAGLGFNDIGNQHHPKSRFSSPGVHCSSRSFKRATICYGLISMAPSRVPVLQSQLRHSGFKASASAGIGMIIRDSKGDAIGALSVPTHLSTSVATRGGVRIFCLRGPNFGTNILVLSQNKPSHTCVNAHTQI